MSRTTMTITGCYEPCRVCWAPVIAGCALPAGWRLEVRRVYDADTEVSGFRGYTRTVMTPHTGDCRE